MDGNRGVPPRIVTLTGLRLALSPAGGLKRDRGDLREHANKWHRRRMKTESECDTANGCLSDCDSEQSEMAARSGRDRGEIGARKALEL